MRKLFVALFVVPLSIFSSILGADNQLENEIQRIDTYLSKSTKKGFNGTVLIAKGEEILLNKGYGFAEKSKKVPFTPDTVTDIGSLTKQFTATGILKLVEQKKLKLDDTLTKFFKELPKDKQHITLHQLLTHSSGLVGNIGESDFDHISTEDYFSQLFSTPLEYQPGSEHRYSNAGYSLLARIIELVAEQDYERFINQHLLQPAGLSNTGYLIPNWNKNLLAKGYHYNVFDIGSMAVRYKNDNKVAWPLKGNGGFNSTQNDMYLWYLALRNNKLLPLKLREQLIYPHVKGDEEGTSHYAYGWAVFNSPRNTKIVAHNGFNGTFFYNFVWLIEEDMVMLYSTNSSTREVAGISRRVEKMLFDKQYQPKAVEVSLMTQLINTAITHKGDRDALTNLMRQQFSKKIKEKQQLNRAGIALLDNEMADKSVVLFKLNIELFPGDGNLWDSLGEGYYKNNELKLAEKAFKKSLALGKKKRCFWCKNAESRLKKIEQLTQNR